MNNRYQFVDCNDGSIIIPKLLYIHLNIIDLLDNSYGLQYIGSKYSIDIDFYVSPDKWAPSKSKWNGKTIYSLHNIIKSNIKRVRSVFDNHYLLGEITKMILSSDEDTERLGMALFMKNVTSDDLTKLITLCDYFPYYKLTAASPRFDSYLLKKFSQESLLMLSMNALVTNGMFNSPEPFNIEEHVMT